MASPRPLPPSAARCISPGQQRLGQARQVCGGQAEGALSSTSMVSFPLAIQRQLVPVRRRTQTVLQYIPAVVRCACGPIEQAALPLHRSRRSDRGPWRPHVSGDGRPTAEQGLWRRGRRNGKAATATSPASAGRRPTCPGWARRRRAAATRWPRRGGLSTIDQGFDLAAQQRRAYSCQMSASQAPPRALQLLQPPAMRIMSRTRSPISSLRPSPVSPSLQANVELAAGNALRRLLHGAQGLGPAPRDPPGAGQCQQQQCQAHRQDALVLRAQESGFHGGGCGRPAVRRQCNHLAVERDRPVDEGATGGAPAQASVIGPVQRPAIDTDHHHTSPEPVEPTRRRAATRWTGPAGARAGAGADLHVQSQASASPPDPGVVRELTKQVVNIGALLKRRKTPGLRATSVTSVATSSGSSSSRRW